MVGLFAYRIQKKVKIDLRLINKLFTTKKFNEIFSHNHSCLLNESVILERWAKNYNLSPKKLPRGD